MKSMETHIGVVPNPQEDGFIKQWYQFLQSLKEKNTHPPIQKDEDLSQKKEREEESK
jgi:hypothetical protein